MTNLPSFVRLLQTESEERENEVEKICKAKHNVDDSE